MAALGSRHPFVMLCCDPAGAATAQSPGATLVEGRWRTFLWEYTGAGCTKTPMDVLADAFCEVFQPEVSFTTATIGSKTLNFESGQGSRPFVTFDGTTVGVSLCGELGRTFTVTVNFGLRDEAESLSESRSFAKMFGTTSDAGIGVDSWVFDNVDFTSRPKKGQMVIRAYPRTSGKIEPPFNSIIVRVAGDYPSGAVISSFMGEASVRVNCP